MPKITLEFTDELYQRLKSLAAREGIDEVEVIRRALGLYSYSHDEVVERKRKLSITDEQDKVLKHIVFD